MLGDRVSVSNHNMFAMETMECIQSQYVCHGNNGQCLVIESVFPISICLPWKQWAMLSDRVSVSNLNSDRVSVSNLNSDRVSVANLNMVTMETMGNVE